MDFEKRVSILIKAYKEDIPYWKKENEIETLYKTIGLIDGLESALRVYKQIKEETNHV